jgi:DNA-binding transcriptional LysR family regulator
MTQPAVTRHVRALEGWLGRSLFTRHHQRLEPTADGLRLWSAVSSGLRGIVEVAQELRTPDRRPAVVLAASPGFAQQWLMPRFAGLLALFEGIEVRLLITDADTEFERRDVDLAVRYGDGRWPGLEAREAFREEIFPVASPALLEAHPALRGGPPAVFREAPLIHFNDGPHPWITWRSWFATFGLEPPSGKAGVVFNNYPLVLQATLAGRGVALGWGNLVAPLLGNGALVKLGPAVPQAGAYHVCWPARPDLDALGQRLASWVRTEALATSTGSRSDVPFPASLPCRY